MFKKDEKKDILLTLSLLQVPSISVEAASASEGSEDEAVVPDKVDSCDSGHEDTCSEPDAHDFEAMRLNERTR